MDYTTLIILNQGKRKVKKQERKTGKRKQGRKIYVLYLVIKTYRIEFFSFNYRGWSGISIGTTGGSSTGYTVMNTVASTEYSPSLTSNVNESPSSPSP